MVKCGDDVTNHESYGAEHLREVSANCPQVRNTAAISSNHFDFAQHLTDSGAVFTNEDCLVRDAGHQLYGQENQLHDKILLLDAQTLRHGQPRHQLEAEKRHPKQDAVQTNCPEPCAESRISHFASPDLGAFGQLLQEPRFASHTHTRVAVAYHVIYMVSPAAFRACGPSVSL